MDPAGNGWPDLMAALAGLFAGVIMAMIVLPHAAILLVFRRPGPASETAVGPAPAPTTVGHEPSTEDDDVAPSSSAAWSMATLAAGSFLLWGALGVAASLLFTVAQRVAPTHVPGLPSVAYAIGVLVVPVFAAPWVAILAPRLWRHALFEFLVFVAVFGIQIPMTAGVR